MMALGVENILTRTDEFDRQLNTSQVREIAHDLNHYLSVIRTATLLVRGNTTNDAQTVELLSSIDHSVERAAALCRLLSVSSAGDEDVDVHDISRVNLGSLLHDSKPLIEVMLPHGCELHEQIDVDVPTFKGSALQVRRVLMNLVGNAIDALGSTGKVTVTVTAINAADIRADEFTVTLGELSAINYVSLQVSDDGCGLDQKTLSHLFNRRFTTKQHGEGLGLPTVARVVRATGGALMVRSVLGEGTTVCCLFPVPQQRR